MTTRSVRTVDSGASYQISKPSSLRGDRSHGRWYKNSRLVKCNPLFIIFLSPNSKCNISGSDRLRCCHAEELLHAHECRRT